MILMLRLLMIWMLSLLSAGQEPPLRCRHPSCNYIRFDTGLGYYKYFYKVDGHQLTIDLDDDHLRVNCDGVGLLESPAFPRAETELHARGVTVVRCPLSEGRSLANIFASVNVTLTDGVLKLINLPSSPQLTIDYFVGLDRLVQLVIVGNFYDLPKPAGGFLKLLVSLRSLEIWHVVLPTGELDALPSLRELRLKYVEGVEWLPAIPTLELLQINDWSASQPRVISRCDSLNELRLLGLAATTLPVGWLENCSRLELLEITEARTLTTLPARLLFGTGALRHLAFQDGALEMLPGDFLHYSPELHTLNLFRNKLRTLPSGMFAVARRVQELNLFWNELNNRAVDELALLVNLTVLDLGFNPPLGDICGTDGYSPIRNSTQLKKLILSTTSVSHICRDWRDNMKELEFLDLSNSNITELSYEELQFTRNVKAEVELADVRVNVVKMRRDQFNDVARGLTSTASVSVRLTWESLECDCRMYWMRRALDLPLCTLHYIGEQTCRDGRRLKDVPPEELVCARREECTALPDACACFTRPDDDSSHDRLLVRVRCENASLDHVPRPQPYDLSRARFYELLLRYNKITELHADHLQYGIKGLDLRNNSLRRVDEETAAILGSLNGSLLLANNPLECSCSNAPLLRALHTRSPVLTDLNDTTCDDGRALYTVPTADCLSLAAKLAVVLAVLLVLVIAAAIFLASHQRRFFMRAVLHRWGIMWHISEPEGDAARRYDAFLTFSHKDEDVACEMMERLEPTYRLCIHYRDWVPGLSISSQVVESVRQSRRTVALVSQHFLTGSWTLAEIREAHTQAMLEAELRLIVVLLEDPATLNMDEQLRRYVDTHTYLRWGEPWFWDKLAVALPRPRNPTPVIPQPPGMLALEPTL